MCGVFGIRAPGRDAEIDRNSLLRGSGGAAVIACPPAHVEKLGTRGVTVIGEVR